MQEWEYKLTIFAHQYWHKEKKRNLKTYWGVRHFANDSMLKALRSVFPDSESGWSVFWRICFPAQKTVAWLRHTRCTIRQAPRNCKRKQFRKSSIKEWQWKIAPLNVLQYLKRPLSFKYKKNHCTCHLETQKYFTKSTSFFY